MHSDDQHRQDELNLDDRDNLSSESDDHIPELTQQIPELTQQIPELTDVVQFAEEDIPELTDAVEFAEEDIPELTDSVTFAEEDVPELTEVAESHEDVIPEDAIPENVMPELTESADTIDEDIQELNEAEAETDEPVAMTIPAFQHSISMTNVSDNELELQQWQIEQQAIAQRSDWQALGQMASVSHSDTPRIDELDDGDFNEPTVDDSTNVDDSVALTDDQQAVLDASWQRLEAFLMEQMPPEIAGTYLSVIEQQIQQSRVQISRDLALLDEDSIESLLDFYQIDRGF